MKRLAVLLISALILFIIFHDLTKGTLPSKSEPVQEIKSEAVSASPVSFPYFEKKASPGETVLSVVEQKLGGPLPVSIEEVIADFKRLNNGTEPEAIKSGQTYKFPDYSN